VCRHRCRSDFAAYKCVGWSLGTGVRHLQQHFVLRSRSLHHSSHAELVVDEYLHQIGMMYMQTLKSKREGTAHHRGPRADPHVAGSRVTGMVGVMARTLMIRKDVGPEAGRNHVEYVL